MKLYVFYISIDNKIEVRYHSVICMAKNEKQAEIIIKNNLKNSCFCSGIKIISIREADEDEIFIS